MKVKVFKNNKNNSGTLNETDESITIKSGRWIDKDGTSHPMKFSELSCFENKNVYYLYSFGIVDENSGKHISLSFYKKQKFLWMQKLHWLQKEENIRYIINILFLIGGIIIGYLNYLK